MNLNGKVVAITGGASGIGAAMAKAFLDEGAAHVAIADVDADRLAGVSASLGDRCSTHVCDVTDAAAAESMLDAVERAAGPIDLCCANAGIGSGVGLEGTDDQWLATWQVNVMGIVHIAQAYVPRATSRGGGYLLVTASAAGLLTNLGDAPYTATKHAAVGLAEWVQVTHGDEGMKVSCLCPQGVRTPLVTGGLDDDMLAANVVEAMGLIEPEECAAAVVRGLADEHFLILPHPEVLTYVRHKADDRDRWLRGMGRLKQQLDQS